MSYRVIFIKWALTCPASDGTLDAQGNALQAINIILWMDGWMADGQGTPGRSPLGHVKDVCGTLFIWLPFGLDPNKSHNSRVGRKKLTHFGKD